MRLRASAALAGLLLLAGCGGSPSSAPSSAPPSTDDGAAKVVDAPITWERVPAGKGEEVLSGAGGTRVTVSEDRRTATLTGSRTTTVTAGPGRVFTRAALDDGTALVVSAPEKDGPGAQRALLVDLDTGEQRDVAKGPGPNPARTGTWAMGDGSLAYTSGGQGDRFCLTVASVDSLEGRDLHCGKPREGLTQLRINADHVGGVTFVNATPMACLTLQTAALSDDSVSPVDEATKCRGWEVVPVGSDAVWSEVFRPGQVELGQIKASVDGSVTELGLGSTGTLTGCGDWVYWSQPPGKDDEGKHGDRLMRWHPGGSVEVAHDTGSAQAPVTSVSCSDDRVSFVVLDPAGDKTYVG